MQITRFSRETRVILPRQRGGCGARLRLALRATCNCGGASGGARKMRAHRVCRSQRAMRTQHRRSIATSRRACSIERAAARSALDRSRAEAKDSAKSCCTNFENSYNYSLRSMSHDATHRRRVSSDSHIGNCFLVLWRGFVLVSQLRDDKQTAAPGPLYGGRTVAKKKKAAKKAGGSKKGAKKKSAKKKSR